MSGRAAAGKFGAFVAICGCLGVGVAPPAGAAVKYFTTPGCQSWTVPAAAGTIDVLATGSAGAQALTGPGGTGDGIAVSLPAPLYGPSLQICVDTGGGSGGFYAGNGGGASGVAQAPEFGRPLVVAGGGGGGGFISAAGGSAGLPAGSAGQGLADSFDGGGGGGGDNTAASGGAGGAGAIPGSPGAATTTAGPGVGGDGGGVPPDGGGGGAGYFGGGGGGSALVRGSGGGGGGGSDFCAGAPRVSSCAVLSGLGSQNGAGVYSDQASVVLAYGGSPMPHPTATTVSCTGKVPVAVCTATVADRWPSSPTRPTGLVRFGAVPGVPIVPPACELVASTRPATASCSVVLTVKAASGYTVTGVYGADRTHRASYGSTFVQT